MIVSNLDVLHEVLRADGTEPVAYVDPQNTEGWISAIGKALAAPPTARICGAFAHAISNKYSRQRMIESYLSLFDAYARPRTGERAAPPAAAKEARP
jgi:hypothetical protein